jgi:hypothetical protein
MPRRASVLNSVELGSWKMPVVTALMGFALSGKAIILKILAKGRLHSGCDFQ